MTFSLPQHALSVRQRQVMSRVASGFSNEEIARELGLTLPTIKTHTRKALRNLRARNRAHAVALFVRQEQHTRAAA